MPAALTVRTVTLPRPLWALAGFAALAVAVATIGPLAFALWLLPDLALLLGGPGAFAGDGNLPPRAVRLYNSAHALPGPFALAAAAAVAPALLPLAVLWLSHIALDRAAGYGLRAADGTKLA